MEILDSEKRRARNLIWNAAADYSFEPDFKAYDEMAVQTRIEQHHRRRAEELREQRP